MRSFCALCLAFAFASTSVAASAQAPPASTQPPPLPPASAQPPPAQPAAQPPPGAQPAPAPAPPGYPPPPGYGAPPPGYPAYPPGYAPPPPGYPPPPYYYPGYYPPPPEMPPPEPEKKERFSMAMMVTGIVLAGAGVVGLFAGAAVYAEAKRDEEHTAPCAIPVEGQGFEECPGPPDRSDEKAAGVALMIAGGVGVAVGVPLLIVGARKVKKEGSAEQPPAKASLHVGPRGGALRLAF